MYNLLCGIWFIGCLFFSKALEKTSKSEIILRIFSAFLLIYKTYFYIMQNVRGNFNIPIEISSVTYFLMSIIMIFKIKSLYSVGSFFGILAGLGFFSFYIFFGTFYATTFSIKEMIIGCVSHGYVLINGLYLFKNKNFHMIEQQKVWTTIFAMLSWALVFYDVGNRGVTFIYYIVKPKFLLIFPTMSLNVLLMIAYYFLLIFAFRFVIKLFFTLNKKLQNVKLYEKINQQVDCVEKDQHI